MNNSDSIFMENIKRGIGKGIISLSDNESRITYKCSREYSVSFKNPEEKVRASYFVELVEGYHYPQERIGLEVTIPRRTPEDRADIVIFEDDTLKRPYLVVECKKDGISDAEFKQAIEQVFGNANSLRAKFASVIAGTTRTVFDVAGFTPGEREKNVISDIPVKYGQTPKYRFIKGEKDKELKVVLKEDLIRTLQKAHDTVWQGGKLAPTTAFDEISKLLFCKLQDEKESSITKKGDPYKFQVGTYETADEVFDRINTIYQAAKQKDAEVFKDDIRLEPKIVYSVVEHLQSINFNKTDLDTKGVAFERFMEDFFRGKMGQFFTPRELIRFCVKMLNPRTNEILLDPACGSGGFLLNAMDLVREEAEQEYDDKVDAYRVWHNFAKENLFGIDINDQIARVCKMNMILHDDGHANVISIDSLTNIQEINRIHRKFKENIFDLILTNPPFGAVVKQAEKPYLKEYELGKDRKTQKTEILFIERCIEFLKEGTGKIAIVLPDSITINTSLRYVRDYIMENTRILAVVSLPDYAFSHFGANVKSSLLFLQKKSKGDNTRHDVFFAQARAIGYTPSGKPDSNNDLPDILEAFRQFSKGEEIKDTENIFVVPFQEIVSKRIDPKGYSPTYRKLKRDLLSKYKNYVPLKRLLIDSQSGDWGVEAKNKDEKVEYTLCYVLRNTNFDNDFNLDFSDIAIRWVESKKISTLQLIEKDILVEKSGGSPYQPVGRVAIINNLPPDKPVVFSNFLQRMRVDSKKAKPEFVYAYLRILYNLGYMEYIQNQTTGIKNLLVEDFEQLQIPMIEEKQQEIFAKKLIDEIYNAKETIKQAYSKLFDIRDELGKQVK